MADSANRPIQQLFEQVFGEEQRATYTDLKTYIQQDGSIFPLVEAGVQGLVRDYGLGQEDAQQFLRRANSLAAYVRRQFIEQSLTGTGAQDGKPSSGLLSMVPGPSYEALFSPNFDGLCPPDALESTTSPVAYLVELLRWIRDRIEPLGSAAKLPLHDRRKDLKPLPVDFNAVHLSVSAVDIIVSVLETFIKGEAAALDLEQALINARYPNGLPYYQHWVTLDAVARYHGMSVGNFVHIVDVLSPYFLQPEAWSSDAKRALTHASRLGPYQRQLLTEPAVAATGRDAFYLRDFGAEDVSWNNLNQVRFFGERTKLDARGVEALLSVRDFAPTRSANVRVYASPPALGVSESERSGSVYLNAAKAPAVTINYSEAGQAFHRLSLSPGTDFAVFDRMNRKLRLDQWLELPSEQVDALLVAAMKAETRGATNTWLISASTVHALGLFQSLRERYGCTAPDFAAFIDEVGIYGRGDALPQFDQVFNNQGGYREPLMLDNAEFPIIQATGATDLTINRLCSGLGIDLKTYQYLAMAIARAQNRTTTLLRSPAVVSAFYRLVKLPRLLGITPVEGVLMLTLLGGESWVDGLAGIPVINANSGRDVVPDVLNLIYALHACVGWCRDRELPVLWMLQQVSPPAVLAAATEQERRLFEQAGNLLPAALFSQGALLSAGVPPLLGFDWLSLLPTLVDLAGLVVNFAGTEAEYLVFAREELDKAVRDGLGEEDAKARAVIVERMLTVLLQARDAQASVVKESLAVYTGLDAERVASVLVWANSTVYQLLLLVLQRNERESPGMLSGETDPALTLLADVRRRSNVVLQLDLSATLLQDYLHYGYTAWLRQDDRQAFSVRTLYYLTALTRAFELGEQPAGKLLDYLREVNALPDPISAEALGLAQKAAAIRLAAFFDWSVAEVRACVAHIGSVDGLLKDLAQLDLLMRIRVLSRHTGMDALTIFRLGDLPETIDKNVYRLAAESALLSLTEASVPALAYYDEVPESIVNITCTVDHTEVIANSPTGKIIFTVMLKDPGGVVIPHVDVYWRASLGTIATARTDEKGLANATYAGKVLGTEAPLFWLDLIEPEYAPTVNVIVDVKTLTMLPASKSLEPTEPVPAGREVEVYGTVTDRYSNLGKDQLVRWSVEPFSGTTGSATIRPAQGLTNQEGLARAFVSSTNGGRFTVKALIESSEIIVVFDPIPFAAPSAE
ncbi:MULTISPECIES: Tc toxin subunit A [unclassified Pseudomonas]|uniref:Tc toxin subunit A n=1 Tax=unclassified Pseudomonas TaxID=196821 RepID=UPI002AC9ED4B|nr:MULTISPECIES: Tc toxin subunit A [unclassified Pseudomonas]MEB0046400.1 Tc toxin subunit A [Pseudomonas sp. Dout3]MEB0097675.1 Tc toxin subunit A [Pseudomonas sp. DC1.2]WPX57736.1 Tc toxin subunit A [Pseudomonas sp. DC1.2]